jgi:hypothetical protein
MISATFSQGWSDTHNVIGKAIVRRISSMGIRIIDTAELPSGRCQRLGRRPSLLVEANVHDGTHAQGYPRPQ